MADTIGPNSTKCNAKFLSLLVVRPYGAFVVPERTEIDQRQLEAHVRQVLERAKARNGLSAERAVQLLGSLQPRGAKDRTSWYDWLQNPSSVSALTYVQAAVMAGMMEPPSGGPQAPATQEAAATDDGDRQRLAAMEADRKEMWQVIAGLADDLRKRDERRDEQIWQAISHQGDVLNELQATLKKLIDSSRDK